MKLALALGGGAGLGWAHIGVLHALAARNVDVVAVSGTSIGALAAVCLAAHRVNILEDLARSTNIRSMMRFLDIDFGRSALLGGRSIARELRHQFGHTHLEDLFIPCAVVAADLISGEEVAIRRGEIVAAVRASIAIPGIFPPVRHDGRLLVDGGVMTPVPVRAVRALSAAPVLAVNLQGDYARRSASWLQRQRAGKHGLTPTRVGRAGLSLIMMHVARQSLALDPPDFELAPRIGHIDVRNFTRADELIALGAASIDDHWADIERIFA
ncbi:MAG: patatin-like phospholipase family protein [Polymorphobacter sp.]